MSTQLGFNFFKGTEKVLTENEIEKLFLEEQNFYIEYCETYWLDRYFKMKMLSQHTLVPSITSTLADAPSSSTNEFKSKTEAFALKTVEAKEWIDHLHSVLEMIPVEYQKLIEEKYLKRRSDGKLHGDDVIYPRLNIGRSTYYEMKRAALEELGRALYGSESQLYA